MPDRKNFSKAVLDALRPARKRYQVHDSGTPNLIVSVTPNGIKTFYRYGRVSGRPARLRIGTYPEVAIDRARRACLRMNAEVAEGIDPRAAKRSARAEDTLGALHAWWMEHHAKPRKRTWKRDQTRFTQYLKPWVNRKLSSITRSEVAELHGGILKSVGPYAANDTLGFLHSLYVVAQQRGYHGVNPAHGIERFPEQERERFLSKDEVAAFFSAMESLRRQGSRDFLMLAILTGARRGNIEAMRWEQVHLTLGVWRVPHENSKNKEPMAIVLPPAAVEILKRRKKESDSDWVFPGQGKSGHIVDPRDSFRRVCKAAGLKDVRIHDLRRTLGSWQAKQGSSLLIIGKSLGHKSARATQVYARLNLDPVRESVERAAEAILEAGRQKKSKKSAK